MASLVLGIAGAAALGPAGLAWGGALGMSGAQIGFTVGSMIGNMMTKLPDVQGPRLGDLKVQSSTYGKAIAIDYGTSRHTGEVMWSSDLIETEHEEDAGGKGGPSQSVTSYTYSVNCAVAVCAGEITGIRRIWANGNLIFDQSETNNGLTGQSDNIRVYTGSETQVADALLESYLGAGNVPAHRGLAYVVFENLQLEKYGNRIPNFSFEVVANGAVATVDPIKVSDMPDATMTHPFIDGILLAISNENGAGNPAVLKIIDLISQTERVINIGDIPSQYCTFEIEYVEYVDQITGVMLNEIWIGFDTIYLSYSNIVAVAFDAASLTFSRNIAVSAAPGMAFIANMHYDKTSQRVLFATNSTTVANGYNSLDPITLEWDAYRGLTGSGLACELPGKGATGKNSILLSHIDPYVVLFKNSRFIATYPTTSAQPYIIYDSSRERFVWYDRNESGNMVFKTIDDDTANEVTEFTPATTEHSGGVFSMEYFPIADKIFYANKDTLKKLNADTFETEASWTFATGSETIYDPREIANVEEYVAMTMLTSPSNGVKLAPLTDRLASNTVTLSSIVTDICNRVGLAAGDIDVTALTDEVEGYTIAQQMSGRAAIDGLQAAFYFDAVESD